MGSGQGQALGGVARPERVGLLAAGPGMQPRALLPEAGDERRAGQLGHGPDPAQPEALEPGPDVGVGREQAGRAVGQERGLVTGRDDDRAIRPGGDRGDRRREVRAGDADGRGEVDRLPPRAARRGAPCATRSTSTGSAPHNGSRPSMPSSNWPNAAAVGSPLPARDGVSRASASNAASAAARSASRSGSTKVASGTSRWALPSGHPAPDAEGSRVRAGVDDRSRVPRLAAQHERAGREGLGASGPCQAQGEVRHEGVQASHGRTRDRGPLGGGGGRR